MCNVRSLITNGIVRLKESDDGEIVEETLSSQARAEHRIFRNLLAMVLPNLLDSALRSEAELAESFQKGIVCVRSDDGKSLKGVVVDWVTPRDGHLQLLLSHNAHNVNSRNVKTNWGFHHPVTGALLCPAGLDWNDSNVHEKLKNSEITVPGDQWPLLIYADCKYDPEELWEGLFWNKLLLWAFKHMTKSLYKSAHNCDHPLFQSDSGLSVASSQGESSGADGVSLFTASKRKN